MSASNKFCPHCGAQVRDTAKFCNSCGQPFADVQPAAQPSTPPPQQINNFQPAGSGAAAQTKSRTPIIIAICCVLCVAIIAVAAIIILKDKDDDSGSSKKSDKSASSQLIGGDNGDVKALSVAYPELSSGQATAYIKCTSTGQDIGFTTIQPVYAKLGSQDVFGVNAAISEYEIMTIGCALTEGKAKAGMSLDAGSLSKEDQYIDIYYLGYDANYNKSEYEITTHQQPDKFKSAEFDILEFSDGSSATFHILAEFEYNGQNYSYEVWANAGFTSTSSGSTDVQQSAVDQYEADVAAGRCYYCHGTGVCQVCFGQRTMSYATYGQGDLGYVNCQGCQATGECSKCGGSGLYTP